jgi:hypothetical protein
VFSLWRRGRSAFYTGRENEGWAENWNDRGTAWRDSEMDSEIEKEKGEDPTGVCVGRVWNQE